MLTHAAVPKMRFILVIATVLTFALSSSSHVVELTDADFDDTLKLEKHKISLVMFYAPWCGHCKKMKPEFEKAAVPLINHEYPITLAKVDCTEAGKEVCSRVGVSGYPTLKIYRDGEMSDGYNGPRDANGIIKHMKALAGPSSKECLTQEECDALLSTDEVVIISYLEDTKDKDVFQQVSNELRESANFAHSSEKLGKGIILQRPKHLQSTMEPAKLMYDGKMNKADIVSWINANKHGMVGHRTRDNVKEFQLPLVVAYYDVDYTKNPKGTNYWRNRVMKVAKKADYQDLNFAVSNKEDFGDEAEEFGINISSSDKPFVALRSNKGKFVMSDEFSVDNLDKFLKAYLDGDIEPYLKSAAIPSPNDGPVKVAVAKNFKELVTDNEKDVLVEFYAPWCGHCKSLAPKYEELGEKMKDEPIEIVKMDATANDVPAEFVVRGFPTIYWLPANTKVPVPYQGGREVNDFIKHIAAESTQGLIKYGRDGKEIKSEL